MVLAPQAPGLRAEPAIGKEEKMRRRDFVKMVAAGGVECLEPEDRQRGEHSSLERDARAEDGIEGGYAVGCDDEELAVEFVEVADLSAAQELEVVETGFGDGSRQFHGRSQITSTK